MSKERSLAEAAPFLVSCCLRRCYVLFSILQKTKVTVEITNLLKA